MRKFMIVMAVATLVLVGCTENKTDESEQGGQNAQREQRALGDGFSRLTKAQQIPTFDYSQERQTLIDVESVRATGSLSTTSFYMEGVGLIEWCPSVGGPVPSNYQLSSTSQWVDLPDDESRQLYEIDQGEPTGVYVGDSQATWVLCLDDNGKAFAKYWEGPVGSTIGIVNGMPEDKRVRVDDLTFEFTTKE